MKIHSLNDQEKTLLRHCLKEHAPNLIEYVGQLDVGRVDAEKINAMREAIGDELVANGLNPDDEPNKYGFELEDLNEKIANLYLWPKELGG